MANRTLHLVGVGLIAIALGGCATKAADTSPSRRPRPATSDVARIEIEILENVNAVRAETGESDLRWDEELAMLAREHSEAMAAGRVPFGHAGIERRLRKAMALSGSHHGAENVSSQPRAAADVASAAIDRWRASARHRQNMLGAFAATGVGVARAADGRFFVTQIFVE